jgi:hypothetical protein
MPLEGGARLQIELRERQRRWKSAGVDAGLFDPEQATIGFFNEYGAPNANIPPRAFMRTTFNFRNPEWRSILTAELKGGRTLREALKIVGLYMAQNINETLRNAPMLFVGNAPKTIAKKGFDYPLLETGRMFKAVSYRVRGVPK